MKVTHNKTSNIVNSGDASLTQPSDWNADHLIVLDAALGLIAALVPAPDKLPYFIDANTAGNTTLTAFARTLLALANAPALLAATGAVPVAGGTMTGLLTLSGDPLVGLHATTKQYVDTLLTGWKPKQSVRAASTANVSIASPGAALDGVTLVDLDRILLKNQTAPAENGIYVWSGATAALLRASDFDTWLEIPGAQMIVEEGTVNADSGWVSTADRAGTLGTTAINFSQFFGTGLFQAASSKLSTLAALASVANLSALANLTGVADALAYFTGAGTMTTTTMTAAARTLIAAGDAAAQRTALGLGSAAVLTAGTAANNALQLDAVAKIPAVDGSQLTNLQASPSTAYDNKFRNGAFSVWQRGVSIGGVADQYTADGWNVTATGALVGVARAANSRAGALTAFGLQITGAASVTNALIKQRIEGRDTAPLASKSVTVQAQIYNSTGVSITPTITVKRASALDSWGTSVTDVNAVALQACANAAYTQISYTFVANAAAGNGLEITFDFGNNFDAGTKSVIVHDADIRIGSAVLVPVFANHATELNNSQRFYTIGTLYWEGPVTSAVDYIAGTATILPMRVAPTLTVTNVTSTNLGTPEAIGVFDNTIYYRRRASATGTGVSRASYTATAEL